MFDEYKEIKRLLKENKAVESVSLIYVDDYKNTRSIIYDK